MKSSLLPLLQCPICATALSWTNADESGDEIFAAKGRCDVGHTFEIRDGIAVLLPTGIKDPWADGFGR